MEIDNDMDMDMNMDMNMDVESKVPELTQVSGPLMDPPKTRVAPLEP